MSTLSTPNTPLKPSSINTKRHFFDSFGNRETEVSANWIVSFCQQRNHDTWRPFRLADLQAFYNEGRGRRERFLFNRLESVVTIKDGMVAVSTQFVAKCYASSPAA